MMGWIDIPTDKQIAKARTEARAEAIPFDPSAVCKKCGSGELKLRWDRIALLLGVICSICGHAWWMFAKDEVSQ